MPEKYDPTQWVDEWPIPGLSDSDRKRIKAVLLKAHARYLRQPIDPYGFIEPMEQAYDGIAGILFEAGILDDVLLGGPLRFLIVEFAVRAQWMASPLNQGLREVFPGYWGRPGPWIAFNSQYQAVFGAQLAEWRARLLERDADSSRAAPQPNTYPDDLPAEREKRIAARKQMLQDYKAACGSVSNRRIYSARNSGLYKAQFSEWVNGILPDSSATTINFERFLREKKPPIPRKPKP
jgi:hypothetical protein